MTTAPKEITIHIQLVSMLRWCLRRDVIMRHVPNGEHRDLRTAQKLKAMGTLAGSADLEFHWVDDGRRRMLHLELKVGRRPPSHAQVMFATRVGLLGDGYHIVRSVDEAIGILGRYGLLQPGVEVSKGADIGRSHDPAFMDAEFAELVERAKRADRYDPTADFAGSLDDAYRAIRKRKAAGGPGWTPKEPK